MFESTSRYADLEDVQLTIDDDRIIAYKKRRFLPSSEEMQTVQEITVVGGDRLDLISNRTLGDPEQFWYICDANDAMHPLDLMGEPGKVLRIPVPGR